MPDSDFTFAHVAESFLTQQRQPRATANIEELVRKYPYMEAEIRSRLPALGLLERTNAGRDVVANATTINGCIVQGTIGKGRTGVVYDGYQPELDRHVALKLITFKGRAKPAVERFAAECKTISNLEHPNIVTTHKYVHDKEVGCIVMELIDGFKLAQLVKGDCDHRGLYLLNNLQADWKAFAKFGQSIASGLAHAHEQGLLHLGITPSEIFVDRDGKSYIADFGMSALQLNDATRDNAAEATPYSAPEQRSGHGDQRSDVFSLGRTLYALAASKAGDGDGDVSQRETSKTSMLVDVQKKNPAVPVDLAKIIMKACSISPDDRYQTANELETVLARFAQGLVADRRQENRPTNEDYRRKTQRMTFATVIGSTILAALLTGCFFLMPKPSFTRGHRSTASSAKKTLGISEWVRSWLAESSEKILHSKAQTRTPISKNTKREVEERRARKNSPSTKRKPTATKQKAAKPKATKAKPALPKPAYSKPAPSLSPPLSPSRHIDSNTSQSMPAQPMFSNITSPAQLLDAIQSSSLGDEEKRKSHLTVEKFIAAVSNGLISHERANQRVELLIENNASSLNVLNVEEKRIRAWLKLIRSDIAKLGNQNLDSTSTETKNVSQQSERSKDELLQILLNGNLNDL